MSSSLIDTRSAPNRRVLHFSTPQDPQRDAEALVAAEKAGTLRRAGNWPLGTALGHLAAFIDYGFDGYPPQLNPPWIIKVLIRMKKRSFFQGPMPSGVRIPGIEGGTVGVEPLNTDEGAARFHRAWQRLATAPPAKPHPIFGPLTHEQWIAMHLRHAELHLSFFAP